MRLLKVTLKVVDEDEVDGGDALLRATERTGSWPNIFVPVLEVLLEALLAVEALIAGGTVQGDDFRWKKRRKSF